MSKTQFLISLPKSAPPTSSRCSGNKGPGVMHLTPPSLLHLTGNPISSKSEAIPETNCYQLHDHHAGLSPSSLTLFPTLFITLASSPFQHQTCWPQGFYLCCFLCLEPSSRKPLSSIPPPPSPCSNLVFSESYPDHVSNSAACTPQPLLPISSLRFLLP